MPHSHKHNDFQVAGRLLWRSVVRCFEDNTPMIAAAVSFYTILSLTPALWVIITATGAIVGAESARARVFQWSADAMGTQAANFVRLAMDRAQETTPLATAIGIIWLLSSATLAFGALYDGLNVIWRAHPPAGRGLIRTFVVKRGIAFLLILFLGVLVVASLLTSTILGTISDVMPTVLPAPHILLQLANLLISVGMITLLFAAIFRLLHDAAIASHDVWVGAIVTALFFEAGKILIAVYLSNAPITSLYGAAGSLAALMLWVYCSAQIVLFGAAFTEQYARQRHFAQGPKRRISG